MAAALAATAFGAHDGAQADVARPTIARVARLDYARVVAPDEESAIAKAMAEFRIEPARAFRLIVVPVE